MTLPKRYNPSLVEPRLQAQWQAQGIYYFSGGAGRPVYAIDTPPPTVSGLLHLGHVYSYSHADFLARFWRMNGYDVLYPMGYDDNGLPTERLVERWLGVQATEIGRRAFIEKCLEVSEEAEKEYEVLWQRLGLSVDWRHTYRTIDEQSRRTSQMSFIDLYRKGLVYRQKAPTIWCPECRTAIAQAELNDMERPSEFVTLDFRLDDSQSLPIATTRPELLPACVAVFVHPEDARYRHLLGRKATVPLFGQTVSILSDSEADPQKGTGAVMCCTFGDTTDVAWWYSYDLPLVEAIGPDGRLREPAGAFAQLSIAQARQAIKQALEEEGLIIDREPTVQSVRVHERCDTPVEYLVTSQWFVRVVDFKEQLLQAGDQVRWYPAHMGARYQQWVENLGWDWCISRQRYFGVTFPVWYCDSCGEVILADEASLPVDPTEGGPGRVCECGEASFTPEEDVMDTWATSSLTPQLVGRWLGHSGFDGQSFAPLSLRPQAHEIIRTWAFYSIVKAHHHFQVLPWRAAAISGWGLAPEGTGKISKSRGGGPVTPMEMIDQYSADAVRYWAASTGLGKDAIISEERIEAGARLVTKLWNVARFSQRFLEAYRPPEILPPLSLADRWLLSRTSRLVGRATELLNSYDYATARSETEVFFWNDLADNYLEMAKRRLYDETDPLHEGARFTLYEVILAALKLFAPFLPYVTEEIYLNLFASSDGAPSIHRASWPSSRPGWIDEQVEEAGQVLLGVATAVRRYKSDHNLSLGIELGRLCLAVPDSDLRAMFVNGRSDIASVTRAREVVISPALEQGLEMIAVHGPVSLGLKP